MFWRDLAQCRVCRRVALAILSAVVTIEVIAVAVVTNRYEGDRIADIEQRGLSSVASMFATHPYPMDKRLLIATAELLLNHSTLAGGVLYREDGTRVGVFGEEPALPYTGASADPPLSRLKSPDGNRVDVLWTPEQINASYVLAARLDTTGVSQQFHAFLVRIAAVILLVSIVIAGAVLAILSRSMFRPLLALQASTQGVADAAEIEIDHGAFANDEIGDVAVVFDTLRQGAHDWVAQVRVSQVELEQAKLSLEQHIASRNAEIADANQVLAREIEGHRRAQQEQEAHLRLARIPEENPNPVLRVSTDSTVLYANPAARPLLAAWSVEPGDRLPERVRNVVQRLDQGASEPSIEVRCDGKLIELVFQPIADAGYVNVYGRDVTQERLAEEDVRQRINRDPLTGLPNRTLLQDRLQQLLSQIRRDKGLAAIHLIDLDHFKDFNESMGSEAGDSFIGAVADRLKGSVRDSDTVARLGGDEFAILQRNAADHEAVAAFAQKLLTALSRPYRLGDQAIRSGASIGVTIVPEDAGDPEQVLRNAEMALYHAKGDGRGAYRFFAAHLNEGVQRRRTTEADLQIALERGDFILLYQPLLSLRNNRIVGAEALIRWRHRDGGLLEPAAPNGRQPLSCPDPRQGYRANHPQRVGAVALESAAPGAGRS